jgi:hypothetical protein
MRRVNIALMLVIGAGVERVLTRFCGTAFFLEPGGSLHNSIILIKRSRYVILSASEGSGPTKEGRVMEPARDGVKPEAVARPDGGRILRCHSG